MHLQYPQNSNLTQHGPKENKQQKNVCQMRPQQKIETYHHHHLYKFAIYDHYYTYIIIIVCHSLWLLPNIYIYI